MSTMKALVTIEDHKAAVKEVPIPVPGEGEILVKVHYAAQNPTDWKAVAAATPGKVVGCDFAGTVYNVNGSSWREGQRVSGFVQGTTNRGAFAEYVVIEASLVYPIPDSVSYQDAAVIPLAFATAAQALFQRLSLPEPSKPAKSAFPVLINGGTSSVGKYAVQLAKRAGLYVIATASKKNHDLVTTLGADAVIDYKDADWPEQVRKLSHDNLQHAFDCISEKETTGQVIKAFSPTKGGHVVCILPRKSKEYGDEFSKVKIESTIVYTVFAVPLTGAYGIFDNAGESTTQDKAFCEKYLSHFPDKPTPQDKAFWEKYLSQLPEFLEKGTIKPNRVKELGGLDSILEGFKYQAEGKLSAEKLVYKIAPSQAAL
ncbi:putative Enoyl reductase (ER) domain-containing protein [Seiridium cardinale]